MSDVSHLATDKDIASMLLDLSNIISVLIGGAIGFIAKYFLEFKKMKEDKKALRQQMITNNIAPMRQAWINDLRKSCAEYFSDINFIIVYQYSDSESFKSEIREEYKKRTFTLSQKLSYIDLLLPSKNDNNEELEAEEFRAELNKIDMFFNSHEEKPSYEDMKNSIIKCRNKLKKLLKKEWEVTKSLSEIEDDGIIKKIINLIKK